MDEVVCEDKWYTLPFDAKLGLEVAQDVTEVYVKELKKKTKNPKTHKANQWSLWNQEKPGGEWKKKTQIV